MWVSGRTAYAQAKRPDTKRGDGQTATCRVGRTLGPALLASDPSYYGRPGPIHNDGCNLAFVDGHCKWMKTSSFFYNQSPTDRYFDLN